MRKRPMCLACLGFMLVLVLLRIAGVPLGTPFSDPKYENEAQQGRKVWIAGTIETYEKKSSNNGYVLRGKQRENLSARKAGRSAGRSRCAGVRNCKKAGKPAQSGDV